MARRNRDEELMRAISEARRLKPSTWNDIKPDWEEEMTIKDAEAELNDFKAGNPPTGWYLKRGDTLLVLPTSRKSHFLFLVWNGRNPSIAFGAIANAPTRFDERE